MKNSEFIGKIVFFAMGVLVGFVAGRDSEKEVDFPIVVSKIERGKVTFQSGHYVEKTLGVKLGDTLYFQQPEN